MGPVTAQDFAPYLVIRKVGFKWNTPFWFVGGIVDVVHAPLHHWPSMLDEFDQPGYSSEEGTTRGSTISGGRGSHHSNTGKCTHLCRNTSLGCHDHVETSASRIIITSIYAGTYESGFSCWQYNSTLHKMCSNTHMGSVCEIKIESMLRDLSASKLHS